MNQILRDKNKKTVGGKLSTRTSIIIYSISIIIFGIILLGKGAYVVANDRAVDILGNKPAEIKLTLDNQNQLFIDITSNRPIDKIFYNWGADNLTELHGKGRTHVEEKIVIPNGTNLFRIKVQDQKGIITEHEAKFTSADVDTTKPIITLEKSEEDNKLKIYAVDNISMDKLEYQWNNEESVTVYASNSNSKIIEEKIEALPGKNTFTVTAIDRAGNKEEKVIDIEGKVKAQITMTQTSSTEYTVHIVSEKNIRQVVLNDNGNEQTTNTTNDPNADLGTNDAEFTYILPDDGVQHTIVIKATTIDGITSIYSKTTGM